MTVQAARSVVLKVGGTPTTMTGEACDDAGEVATIVNTAKRAIDPATAITVYDAATPVAAGDTVVDYVAGTITKSPSGWTGAVTLDAKYIPLLTVAECRALKVNRPQAVMMDTTRLGDAGPRAEKCFDKCELVLTEFRAPHDDLDAGGGVVTIETLLAAGAPVFIEADLGGETLRGWFAADPESRTHGVGADPLVTEITFKGVCRTCLGRPTTEQALFSLTLNA